MTVEEIERWIKKMETLTSKGAKIVYVKHLLQRSAKEIIGEDETPESYEPKALTETELSLAHHAVQFHARNALRREQRKQAGLDA